MAGRDGMADARTGIIRRCASGIRETASAHPLAFLVAFALAVRVFFFVGIQLGDDLFYIKYAFDLAHGNFHLPGNHWETRLGLVLPVALSARLFGFNEYSLALFPLACSIANVALIYHLAARLFSRRCAVVSAFLLSVFPLEIYFATSVYPTVPLATLGAASVSMMLAGLETNSHRRLFLAGLLLGLSYLVHPTGLFIALPATLWVAFSSGAPGGLRKAALLVAGLSLVVLTEVGTYKIVAGNPLLGFGKIVKSFDQTPTLGVAPQPGGQAQAENFLFKDRSNQIQRGSSFWLEPLLTLTTQQEFGLFYFMIIPAAIFLAARREKSPGTVLLLLWFTTVGLYLFYGSVSPFEYRPLRRWPRYYSPVTVPGVVLLAAALESLRARWQRAVAATLLVLAVSSLAILAIDNWHRYAAVHRIAASYMKSKGGIFLAEQTYWSLAPFLDYDPAILRRHLPQDGANYPAGDVYLVQRGTQPRAGGLPEVVTFATPKSIIVRLAEAARMPSVVVSKLWRKETLRISRIR